MIASIERTCQFIDRINRTIGHTLCALLGAMAVLVTVIVLLRTFFDWGAMAMQESVIYLHAIVFMLCLAFTAQTGGHVRVDIFYRKVAPQTRAWIDLFGALCGLLPFSLFIFWSSLDFVVEAWRILEGSNNPGGLPLVFLLKTLIPLTALLLALRALVEIFRTLLHISVVFPQPYHAVTDDAYSQSEEASQG